MSVLYTAFNDTLGIHQFRVRDDRAARAEVRRVFGDVGTTSLYRRGQAISAEEVVS